MKPRVFLDTNVFVYAFEFPDPNSRRIVELLNRGEIEAVICEQVLHEVQRYFAKYYGKEVAGAFRHHLLVSCTVIPSTRLRPALGRYKGKIKDKDLEQLTAVKELGLRFLVSFDRDFAPFEEYVTPKEFLRLLGKEAADVEF